MSASSQPPASSTEWETPPYLYDALDRIFGFNLDPAATDRNALCESYFTVAEDGLSQRWVVDGEPARVFCNPPFADGEVWVPKMRHEATRNAALVVGLVLASTDTHWWHDNVMGWACRVWLVNGRLPFCYQGVPFDNNRYSNAIVLWHDGRYGPPEFRSVSADKPRF